MKKLLILTLTLGLLTCGVAFAQGAYHHYDGSDFIMHWDDYWADFDDTNSERWEYWYIHRALQIERVGNTNGFLVTLLDTRYTGVIPEVGLGFDDNNYLDIWELDFWGNTGISLTITDDQEKLLGIGNDGAFNHGDARVEYFDEMPPDAGSLTGTTIPWFYFIYEGNGDTFYLWDSNFSGLQDEGGYGYSRMPIPAGGSPGDPAAVPEPATLFGFGVPMLMVGLGRLRNLRK